MVDCVSSSRLKLTVPGPVGPSTGEQSLEGGTQTHWDSFVPLLHVFITHIDSEEPTYRQMLHTGNELTSLEVLYYHVKILIHKYYITY